MSLAAPSPSAAELLQLDDHAPMSDDEVRITTKEEVDARAAAAAAAHEKAKRNKSLKRHREERSKEKKAARAEAIDLAESDDEAGPAPARPIKLQRTAPPSSAAAPSAAAAGSSSSNNHADADDVDIVGLGRELGLDLSSTPARIAAPLSTGIGFETMVGEEGPASGKGKHEKKAARRYFDGEDITTKCYNCGKVGHEAAECTNATVYKPCWLCGLRGHPAFRCTRELCFRCLKEGHQSRECKNPKVILKCCFWCGSSSHAHTECMAKGGSVDLTDIRCYVCGEKGHLNCATASAPPTTINTISCSNCGLTGHPAQACTEEQMPMHLSVDNFGNVQGENATPGKNNRTPRKDWMAEMECFYCNQKGHLKMDCPKRKAEFERFGASAGGYNRRPSFGAGNGITSQHRGPRDQDGRYSDHTSRPAPHSSTPFSRAAARERERKHGSSDRSESAHGDRERDRDRNLMDRSYDRRSSGGGYERSRDDRDQQRDGRSRERSNDYRARDARSAPPPKRR
jgi:hypothetical protein